MAMMMTGRVLLVCALCVLWCGACGGDADGSSVEYSFAGRRAQLRRGCVEKVGRRTGGGANISAVEECVRREMDGVRAVVDGRSRWRRRQFAVAAADGGSDDKSGQGSDDTLKVLSSSDPMSQAGQDREETQQPKNSLEVKITLETTEDSQITEELNVSSDDDPRKQTESQVPTAGQPEGEKGTKNLQPPPPPPPVESPMQRQPSPGPNTLQSVKTHPSITAENNLNPQDGSHAHETGTLQTKGSKRQVEQASSLQSPQIVSHSGPESTTPLSNSTESSDISGSTVEKSGANNPKHPAASVTQHDSEGDNGPAALPASNTELQSEEIPNAGITSPTHDDGDEDSSPAAPTAERPTAGTRSTQAPGDASGLDRANNDDVNGDVAHKDKTAEFEASSGDRDNEADNDERYTTVPENATNKAINTETIAADSSGSTAVSHTTSPLLLLLVACAAAAAVLAA
ncbi:mucin-associated surface protein (MASP) [Trypanosoma cruzi Dm28c]|uniref:Mucin-associated surface protein (MASP) n=2 Tax=Trypanosoma cruzi TaxID=5693 RepID=V5BBH9_TRYCR|nr:mucin-associated surface protein (MASP) [Trypanosoma cruzi Dm28c]PBJ76240.1 mucin-associated surface protein [Trypanosoma cruzi cruzi]PWU85208.1 Mucin-associated surface protein (MASP) [Trypanosoma cruzi]